MKFSAIPLNHVTLMYISDNMSYSVPYMGKVSQGKFWRTVQVKLLARKHLVKKLKSVHMSNLVYL